MAQPASPDRINLMIEALSRLEPEQVNANPKLKEALSKVLEATRGTPRFVDLVRKFQIKDQNAALLEVAIANPASSLGADALRLLLENQGIDLLKQSLAGTNAPATLALVENLGNVGSNQIVPLLAPLVGDPKLDPALRKRAVRGLAQAHEGAAFLLQLANEDKLGTDLKLTAGAELNRSRWPEIKTEAARVLPLPQSRNSESLPSITDLAKQKGNPARGAEVFARADVGCINCHQVHGRGIDFGPKLSEIGTKLAKEALYESILDPSAGISFGYEAWQVQLKDGDDVVGLVVSETGDELVVKTQNGVETRYKKSEIAQRSKQTLSIMPAGLQQVMSVEDLVDLVEYLVSLKAL